jgi:NAD+ kinase
MRAPPQELVGILRHRLVEPESACLAAVEKALSQGRLRSWQAERGAPPSRYGAKLKQSRLILTVGGDGTLLYGARLAAPRGIPLLGVNLGRLGFLTELEAGEVEAGLSRFLTGDYWVDERTLLEVTVERQGRAAIRELGLNEAVVQRDASVHLLRLHAYVDGQAIGTFDADGVITATATGSTAYSLAAGGPVLEPGVEGLVMVPLNPFALTVRPIVFPPRQSLTIELARDDAFLSVDGRQSRRLRRGDRIRLAAHDRPARLVRFTERARF